MIRNSLFILIALLLAVNLSSCEKAKEIGLQLYSVRDDMRADPAQTIIKVGEIGYNVAEAAGYGDGKFYGMEPLEFKKLLNDNGMEFLSSHTGRPVPDSSNYEEVMAWWDLCIDAHAAAGVKYIVQPFMDQYGYGSLEDLQRYCDYFNEVGAKCNAKGIRFGYHNHDKEFGEVDGIVRYDYMLQNTDPEKVFFQLDLYWIVVGGKNPVDYFNQYPGRFELWHVKDKEELGASGMMDFASMFAAAEVSGMKHIIVEVERYNYTPLESVKMSYDFLMEADYVK
ncbi:MAG TPA: sugar phosphate isomerase/epimerase [Prolixibacteraceae bacterium]|nr:sugar phosphate isomerase/epimerase [Prolixibacteraceae bacterium]